MNGVPQPQFEGIQNTYSVYTNGTAINPKIIADFGIQYVPATDLTSDAKKISMQVIDIYDYDDETAPDLPDDDDDEGDDNGGGTTPGGGNDDGGFAG